MIKYKTIQTILSVSEVDSCVSFGIIGVNEHNDTIICVPNIFLTLEDAESFAKTLNHHEVSPIHILEIIDDML